MSDVRQQVEAFLAEHDPTAEEPLEFLRARFDAGLRGSTTRRDRAFSVYNTSAQVRSSTSSRTPATGSS